MRKVLLISLAVILGLVIATDPTPLEKAVAAVKTEEGKAKKADDAYKAEATAEVNKKVKEVVDAEKALKDLAKLKADATPEEKKTYASEKAKLEKALGEAVDKASKKTTYADKVKADEAVTKAKAAVDAFYCDAAKLEFPLFTKEDCTKAVTGDAQKLPEGFTAAVTEGLKDPAKACVTTGADKGTKSVKVTCEMADKKATITVASFSDDKCKTALEDKDKKAVPAATIVEGTCAANPATASTWIKVGAKAGADGGAAAADEGMGTGMIILIVVIVVVAIAALYFVKTKYFSGKGGE